MEHASPQHDAPTAQAAGQSRTAASAKSALEVVSPGHQSVHSSIRRGLKWIKSRSEGLEWLYARIPFSWRLALRRRMHAATGNPMPPLLPVSDDGPRGLRRKLAASQPTSPGVNLLGFARGEFGVAESLRAYARALESSGYPFSIFNFDVGTASRQRDHSLDRQVSDTLPYAINAFYINADQMPIARGVLGRHAFAGRHNIGFWLWELEKFPRDWRCAFDLIDEVWAPTAFVRDAIGMATRKPVLRMPMPIEFDVPTGMDRAHFGLPRDAFIFLFSFDFNGFVARKNPKAVIAAFRQAFDDGTQGAQLLVKCSNGARFPDELEALQRSVADDPRIGVRDGFLSRAEMFALQSNVDGFVSLHRAEGFGLGLAECMYLGKPVIATAYSGNLDFMDRDNSLLVDCRLIPLRKGDYPYWQAQKWADPDIAHAARLMRALYDDRNFAKHIGAKAAASVRRSHSRTTCAGALVARMREIDHPHRIG